MRRSPPTTLPPRVCRSKEFYHSPSARTTLGARLAPHSSPCVLAAYHPPFPPLGSFLSFFLLDTGPYKRFFRLRSVSSRRRSERRESFLAIPNKSFYHVVSERWFEADFLNCQPKFGLTQKDQSNNKTHSEPRKNTHTCTCTWHRKNTHTCIQLPFACPIS